MESRRGEYLIRVKKFPPTFVMCLFVVITLGYYTEIWQSAFIKNINVMSKFAFGGNAREIKYPRKMDAYFVMIIISMVAVFFCMYYLSPIVLVGGAIAAIVSFSLWFYQSWKLMNKAYKEVSSLAEWYGLRDLSFELSRASIFEIHEKSVKAFNDRLVDEHNERVAKYVWS